MLNTDLTSNTRDIGVTLRHVKQKIEYGGRKIKNKKFWGLDQHLFSFVGREKR